MGSKTLGLAEIYGGTTEGGKLSDLHVAAVTDSRFIPIARRIARHITPGALLLLFLTGCVYLAAIQLAHLFLLDETGYGDSYVLYDVQHFAKTGVIYRDLSQPPYLPALYSPTVGICAVCSAEPGRL